MRKLLASASESASVAEVGLSPTRHGKSPSSSALEWLRRQEATVLGALFLTLLYLANYLGHAALPGNNIEYPLGWWGWFDQSKFLESVQALSRLDLSSAHHWYPLGYALLGAPFARLGRQHPFFFVDLGSLLIAYSSFVRFSVLCGVKTRWGVILFVLAGAGDPILFQQWIIPWNTAPLAAVMWLLLMAAGNHIQGERRPALLGLLAACVPILRPTDALIAGVPIAASLTSDILMRRLQSRDVAKFMTAAFLPLAAYGTLHVTIYGLQPSDYMRGSRVIGFTLHNIDLKAYLILVDPRAWIGGGEGLIRRCPWLIIGLAGSLTAFRRPLPAMLSVTLVVHGVLYFSYVDLLPMGFWRYNNVHYWTLAFPGFALLGFLLLRDLRERQTRASAVGALTIVLAVLCISLDPEPAGPAQRADAVDLSTGPRDFNTVYFGSLTITDAEGKLENIRQMRAFPLPTGVRILALTRSLGAPVAVSGQGLDGEASIRLRVVAHWCFPFWPWSRTDEFYSPRD